MGSIQIDRTNRRSIPLSDVLLRSTPPSAAPSPRSHHPAPASPALDSFDLLPFSLSLGGKQPATLEGHIDDTGYTLHLTGTVVYSKLLELGNAVPQFGEGLLDCLRNAPVPPSAGREPVTARVSAALSSPAPDYAPAEDDVPIHVDLTATRTWGGAQTWRETTPAAPSRRHRK